MTTAVIDTVTVVIVSMTAVTVNMTAVILRVTGVSFVMTGVSGAQQAQWALRFAALYRLSVTSSTRLKPASLRIASTSETRS